MSDARPDGATDARGCTIAFCEAHRDVEIIPGPFCPVCMGATCRNDGLVDGIRSKRPTDDTNGEKLRELERALAAARRANTELHRRCQRAESLSKWDDLGLARTLVSEIESVRHRYAMLRLDAARTREEDSRHVQHIVGVMREWIRDGRPSNHTAGKEADALVDEAIATARDRDEWKSRAERAEAECAELRARLAAAVERDASKGGTDGR